MAHHLHWVLRGLLILIALGGGLVLISSLSNIGLPRASTDPYRLGPLEKAQLAEALHLKATVGDSVWPGFGSAGIPMLVWNETNSFLVGHPSPSAAWEVVPDDSFESQPYYRRPVANPTAFAVQVDDIWVGSMGTREWTPLALHAQIREELPSFLRAIFPYRLIAMAYNTDWHIAAELHEAFHAYQAQVAPEKLAEAEAAHRLAGAYPADDANFQTAWKDEMALLQRAVQAESENEATELARQFLAARDARRNNSALTQEMITYERQREWVEGTAKYVELQMWRAGAMTEGYEPLAALDDDRGFKSYAGYGKRFDQEIKQMMRVRFDKPGDGRFYYSGMAQAVLLDRFAPGWKAHAFDDGVWLEDQLARALAGLN